MLQEVHEVLLLCSMQGSQHRALLLYGVATSMHQKLDHNMTSAWIQSQLNS
jgi:hypothetical protein